MLIGITDATRKIPASATSTDGAADRERHARRDEAPEHEQQRERGERQRDELGALQVALGHRLDVAVERGPAARSGR